MYEAYSDTEQNPNVFNPNEFTDIARNQVQRTPNYQRVTDPNNGVGMQMQSPQLLQNPQQTNPLQHFLHFLMFMQHIGPLLYGNGAQGAPNSMQGGINGR